MAKHFAVGARVAWARGIAHLHGGKSVLLASAVKSIDATAVFGTVTRHDDVGRPVVDLDDGSEWTLTNEELVNIEE